MKQDKIIIVKFQALGDMIMSTVGIRMIRQAFPSAEITVLTMDSSAEMIRNNPDIDHIISAPVEVFYGYWRLLRIPAAIMRWRRKQYDLAISFHVGNQVNLLVKALQANRFIIPGKGNLKSITDTKKQSFAPKLNHYTQAYPKIAKEAIHAMGGNSNHQIPSAVICLSKEEKNQVNDILSSNGLQRKKFIAIFPGGGANPGECVIVRRYPKLAESISSFVTSYPKISFLLLGAKTDQQPCDQIKSAIPSSTPVVDMHGKTNLRLYLGLIEAASLLVTSDSSALHIATALNTPTVAIFGPTDPTEKVDSRANITILAPKNIAPSYTGKFDGNIDEALHSFDEITPEMVADAISTQWEQVNE